MVMSVLVVLQIGMSYGADHRQQLRTGQASARHDICSQLLGSSMIDCFNEAVKRNNVSNLRFMYTLVRDIVWSVHGCVV